MLADTVYFDCERPRDRQAMADPEGFLEAHRGRRLVLDEIHRLDNPSELMKISADHYSDIRIIATGSSQLWLSSRFRDTLTGRKTDFLLTPMISRDLDDFEVGDLRHRLLNGGLPEFFLADGAPERDFQEWMDSFWAKDILELFRLEKRHSFFKFMELILAGSGGIFEATRFSRACEVSRPTISNYLSILSDTLVVSVIRPFSTYRSTEIVAAPKVYGFDTGFVSYAKGWRSLRLEDCGLLWEHVVLNEIQAHLQKRTIAYWRSKRGHEVDFILNWKNQPPTAIECKWSVDGFDAAGLKAFRRQYPDGDNWIVCSDVSRPFFRSLGDMKVNVVGIHDLEGLLATPSSIAS